MKVIYGINKVSKFRKPVVALGVFDGVHRGHAYILKGAVKIARRIKGTAIALTFYPHPQKEDSLSSLEHRLKLIESLGLEVCIVINFNRSFAQIAAEDFVKRFLVKKIAPRYICVGSDFKFGREAFGDVQLLDKLSREYSFKLKAFKVISQGNRRISSSGIRNLILNGKLQQAAKLLGRPVSILGTVIKGTSLARKLGFPTANIDPHHEVIPPAGVYAVKIIFQKLRLNGVCYIGTKPTLKAHIAYRISHIAKHIEVYLFNFHQNIYGKYLEIQFVKRIRGERKFTSLQVLANQVKKDITFAKSLFSCH